MVQRFKNKLFNLKVWFIEFWPTVVNFFYSYLWVIIILVILFPAFYIIIFKAESNTINVWEKRMYLGYLLLVLVVIAFATLRLYNSVIQNSSFMIRMKTSNNGLMSKIDELTRELSSTQKAQKTTMSEHGQKVARSSDDLSKIMKELKDAITRDSSFPKS